VRRCERSPFFVLFPEPLLAISHSCPVGYDKKPAVPFPKLDSAVELYTPFPPMFVLAQYLLLPVLACGEPWSLRNFFFSNYYSMKIYPLLFVRFGRSLAPPFLSRVPFCRSSFRVSPHCGSRISALLASLKTLLPRLFFKRPFRLPPLIAFWLRYEPCPTVF